MSHLPSTDRYARMRYVRCGRSGLKLPVVSLGLWHNFGGESSFENGRAMIARAFDLGITHFDLANDYGPPPGSAEESFGRILKSDFRAHRDEMIISTKAGYLMWPGPYGEWGSRKYLVASLDQSLVRMGLAYVDIYYSHRPDPETPLEETMAALDQAVRQGKALYAGISNYKVPEAKHAIAILRQLGTPCLIHQPSYSMLNRWVEEGLLDLLEAEGVGSIAFSSLARGPAHRQVPGRNTRRFTGGRTEHVSHPGGDHVAGEEKNQAPERYRGRPGTEPGADGPRMGAARGPRDLRADRREQAGPDRRLRRRAQEPGLLRGGAFENRRGPERLIEAS